jgi:hypothetical protein
MQMHPSLKKVEDEVIRERLCRVPGPQRWMKYISQLATMTDPAKSTKQ